MQKQKEARQKSLASLLIDWDVAYPGEDGADMEIPAEDWAHFIEVAKAELKRTPEAA